MLTKAIQITENVTIEVRRFKPENLKVDAVRFLFKNDAVAYYLAGGLENRASVCLYELVDETARIEAEAFIMSSTTQKEMLSTLKGLKAIREEISGTDKAIFNVFLKAFDAN